MSLFSPSIQHHPVDETMANKGENLTDDAYDQWTNGDPLEAGKLIFENLPINDRPMWAYRILKYVLDRAMITSPIFEPILTVARAVYV